MGFGVIRYVMVTFRVPLPMNKLKLNDWLKFEDFKKKITHRFGGIYGTCIPQVNKENPRDVT